MKPIASRTSNTIASPTRTLRAVTVRCVAPRSRTKKYRLPAKLTVMATMTTMMSKSSIRSGTLTVNSNRIKSAG